MAIDSIGPGFNPHLLSDQSPVNAAISSLVLPSSFRPIPDPTSATGSRWELDPTLLESAEVTSEDPFTVTYKIRPEAQWTDNAPIAADDYWYLWQQMVSEPGVVDPAGYDLITGVQSVEGGKTAVVTFSQPYPAWRELFNDILPAHIVKDVPGGFAAGLLRALPVTGGQFRVDSIDPQRDEILLARNDRYWAEPAKPDQILFRRGGAPAVLADSIRNGDTQVAQVHGGQAAFIQLGAIPDVRTARIVTPRVMQVTLRAQQPDLQDSQVRKAILGLLDVDLLAAVGAGSDNTVTLAQAQVRSPSDPGYVPTAPPALSRESALDLLRASGYTVEQEVSTTTPMPPPTPGSPPPALGPHQQGRRTTDVRDRGRRQRSDVGGRGQHRRRSAAQRGHLDCRAGARSADPLRRCLDPEPRRRHRRLAPGRRRPGDRSCVAIRLCRTRGHAGAHRPGRRHPDGAAGDDDVEPHARPTPTTSKPPRRPRRRRRAHTTLRRHRISSSRPPAT